MRDETLDGVKKDIYVLVKILKYMTKAGVTSYQCKYGLDVAYEFHTPEKTDMGEAIREVINHPTLKGKFNSLHKDLEEEGIKAVEVGEEGIHLIRDTQPSGGE